MKFVTVVTVVMVVMKLVMVVMVCDADFSLQPLQISLQPLQSITSHQKWS